MADAATATTASDRLPELVGRLDRQEGFAEVVESLSRGHAATLDGVWGSSCALVAASLATHAPASLVVVCPHVDQVDDLIDDLSLFASLQPERFPAWEPLPSERAIHDEAFGDRVRLLKLLFEQGKGDRSNLPERPDQPSVGARCFAQIGPDPFFNNRPRSSRNSNSVAHA
jgi:hypothetical protein